MRTRPQVDVARATLLDILRTPVDDDLAAELDDAEAPVDEPCALA